MECQLLANPAAFVYPEDVNETPLDVAISRKTGAILARLQAFLVEHSLEAYIVGGMVRDLVTGRDKADIDIAVAGDALSIGQEIAGQLDAHCVVLDTQNGVVRLLPHKEEQEDAADWQLDIATLQGTLAEDLSRRDFTINAMAINLAEADLTSTGWIKAVIIDPLGGLSAIQNKLIQAVYADAFRDDAIRLLRGVRLGAELGFSIEAQTEALMLRDHDLIQNTAGERVREELLKIFALPGTYDTVVYMDKLGLLTAIMPEMAATRDIEQPVEHTWNVFHHSARSISALDYILRRGDWEFTGEGVLAGIPWDESIEAYFNVKVSPFATRRILTKVAALLHDVAKPQTRMINEFGKVRFYGHPQEGAPIAAAILERLRFSNREIKFIETVVRYHLRPVQMTEDGAAVPTRRAVYRYFRDLGEAAVANLYFSLADHLATRGPNLDKTNWDWQVGIVAHLVAAYQQAPPPAAIPKLIDGHDLQRELGMGPGQRMGELLEEVREAQAAGEVTTRQQALDYVKGLIDGSINVPTAKCRPFRKSS